MQSHPNPFPVRTSPFAPQMVVHGPMWSTSWVRPWMKWRPWCQQFLPHPPKKHRKFTDNNGYQFEMCVSPSRGLKQSTWELHPSCVEGFRSSGWYKFDDIFLVTGHGGHIAVVFQDMGQFMSGAVAFQWSMVVISAFLIVETVGLSRDTLSI